MDTSIKRQNIMPKIKNRKDLLRLDESGEVRVTTTLNRKVYDVILVDAESPRVGIITVRNHVDQSDLMYIEPDTVTSIINNLNENGIARWFWPQNFEKGMFEFTYPNARYETKKKKSFFENLINWFGKSRDNTTPTSDSTVRKKQNVKNIQQDKEITSETNITSGGVINNGVPL